MKLKSLIGLLATGFSFAAMGAGNGKMIEFTCSGYAGASTLANFPVLIRLAANSPAGFQYSDMISSSSGAELRFYDESENVLPHEIESWDPSGTSYVWVKVPALSRKSVFTMHYGKAPSGAVTPADVWNSGYVGVWHFAEASGDAVDATGHGLSAVQKGTDRSAQVSTTGAIGAARVSSTAGSKTYFEVADDARLDVGDAFTVSGWYNMSAVNASAATVVGRQYGWFTTDGWMFEMAKSATAFSVRGASNGSNNMNAEGLMPSAMGDWVHFALVYNGASVTVYANGAPVETTGAVNAAKDNNTAMMFGYGNTRSYFYGAFDEFRLASGVVSEDWIKAECAQAGSTFLSAEVMDAPDPTQQVALTIPALDHFSVSSVRVGGVAIPKEQDGTYLVSQGASVTVAFAADSGYALSASAMTFTVRGNMSIPSAGRPVSVPLAEVDLKINEIGASNDEESGIETVFGGKGLDWIEIRNRSAVDIDVTGWYLTDGPDKGQGKWTRIEGDGVVPANGYRIVWASKDFADWASSEAHVAISLSTSGEPLLLAAPGGERMDEIANFGKQLKGVSCGLVGESAEYGYFTVPTPGAANGTDAKGRPTPLVTLSEPHGYKTSAFELVISCPDDPAAEIRYTLDGSSPTASSTEYTGPIRISKTTVVRAAVPVENSILQSDAAATYLFVDDILRQSADNRPAGFPATSASGQSLVYGMAPAIAQSSDADTRRRLLNGFTNSIRTVSIVIDPKHMFDDETGIYVNPWRDGREWERQTMLEQINPTDPADGFTAPCGIKIRGAFSRGLAYPKHSFHLVFRSEYGAGKLEFPLFGDEGASSFDRIDLRTSQNCSWANTTLKDLQRGLFTLIEDVFSRDTQRDMGQPYNRSRYYNLFINGAYWGVYQTEERVNQYCGETNNGGQEANYDVVRTSTSYASSTSLPVYTTGTVEGEDSSWKNLWDIVHEGFGSSHPDNYNRARGLNPDGTRNAAYPVYLNPENLIDYMLIAHWTCNCDTPAASEGKVNNQAAYRNRVDGEGDRDGFVWHLHDCEYSLGTYEGPSKQGTTWGTIRYGADTDDFAHYGPALINRKLMSNAEYKQLFADLAYRHLFRADATLSTKKACARFGARMAELDDAVVCESARWGNGKTRADWLWACHSLTNDFMGNRSTWMKMAYRAPGYTDKYGWYPSIDAPTVRNSAGAQLLGGETVDGSVTLTGTEDGTVYFTTDGSDPRLVGGAVSTSAQSYSAPIAVPADGLALNIRVKTSSDEWSALERVELKGVGGTSVADALRFHSFDGVPAGDPDGDKGEWIALTNLNLSAAVDLEGVRIVIVKDGETEAKCDFTLAAGTTVAAGGSIRLEQSVCGWNKITNNKIKMFIYAKGGALVQTASVTQKEFASYYGAGGPGGDACLVATSFADATTGADWIASDFIIPPAPAAGFYTGVYSDTVTIVDSGEYVLSNATFNGGLVLGSGAYVLKNAKGTVNTASSVQSTGTVVFKQKGTFGLKGSEGPLMSVGNLFVSNGTFRVDFASDVAKSIAVNVGGSFAVEDEGKVDVTVGGVQNYGIYLANKNEFCRIGDGGTFLATVNGRKCAALYGNKGSVDADVEDGSKVRVTLNGNEGRAFNFAGKIKLKGGDVEATGEATSLSNKVFKSDKSISVKSGTRVSVNVPGAGSEGFSCADAFSMEGGQVEVVSADDCVGAETNVVITGGRFYGRSLGNDVFDTNEGDITVDGGIVLAYTTAQEPTDTPSKTVGSFGFDVNDNTLYLNGGTVVAIGGDNLTGDHFPAIAGAQGRFVEKEAAASKYSGKYVSHVADGMNTTVGIPAIDSTKCAILFSSPGMAADPKITIADVAPSEGSIGFHEVYVTVPKPVEPFALGDPSSRPSTDYNGSVVTVAFTGDIPDGASTVAVVRIGGNDYVGTVNVTDRTISLAVPSDVVTAGNVYPGLVTVSVGGVDYTKPVVFSQGTPKIDEEAEWVRESAETFGSTGTWTGEKVAVADGRIGVSNATFTASRSAPSDAVVAVMTTLDFGAAAEKPLETSSRAGIQVVNVGGINRYAVLTASGEVTNLDVVAKLDAAASVTVVLSNAENTVSYAVDGVNLGTYPSIVNAGGVSTFRYTGGTTVSALNGSYTHEELDANLAKVGDTEYATVAEALAAAGDGPVTLLWDATWNPTNGVARAFVTDGHRLVVVGDAVGRLIDNGDGTMTARVVTSEDVKPVEVEVSGDTLTIAIKDAQPGFRYGIKRATALGKGKGEDDGFDVDPEAWVTGEDILCGKALEIRKTDGATSEFFKVVVEASKP